MRATLLIEWTLLQIGKPVVLEEYGSPLPKNHTASVGPWVKLVESLDGIAGDQLWQFGTANLSVDAVGLSDLFTVFINEPEFQVLCRDHAAAMVAKKVKA
jgi:mannan endo-1,4-beta-mannosidase